MTDRKEPPIPLSSGDIAHLARLLQNIAPGTEPIGTLTPVADGYSATILRATTGIAVRVPKTERAGLRQIRTFPMQRRLARLPTVPVPLPIWALPMGDPFPFGVAGYAWLDGAPLAPDGGHPDIASQLGAALADLHRLDTDSFQHTLPGRNDVDAERERIVEIAAAWLHGVEPPETMDRLAAWWDAYRDARAAATYAPAVIHGDLWYGNMLVDDDGARLTGIVDWENLALDDPAQDFATLMHSGEMFSHKVMDAYERAGGVLDQALIDRTRWHWEFRELTGIAFAVEAGDDTEALDAARKLREGALSPLFTLED